MSVGMPQTIYLEQYAYLLRVAFKEVPYLVGTALTQKTGWRDVDVRIILTDEEWEEWDFGKPEIPNQKWTAFCAAFSELGKAMTQLPIDFQFQQMTFANSCYDKAEHPREALSILWREQ